LRPRARRLWRGRLEAAGAALVAPACGVPRKRRSRCAAQCLMAYAPSGTVSVRGFSTRHPASAKRAGLPGRPRYAAFSAHSPHLHQVAPRAAPAASTDFTVIVWKNLWGYRFLVGPRLRATGCREYLHRFDSNGRVQARSYNAAVLPEGWGPIASAMGSATAPARGSCRREPSF